MKNIKKVALLSLASKNFVLRETLVFILNQRSSLSFECLIFESEEINKKYFPYHDPTLKKLHIKLTKI